MIIRFLRSDDIPSLLVTVAECWGRETAHTAEPEFRDMHSGGAYRPTFYVAEVADEPVGVAGYNASWSGYGLYNMCWIGVRRNWRGRGFARQLVDRCLCDLDPIAEAVMLVTHIPDFYRPWGFVDACRLPRASATEGDVLMVRARAEQDGEGRS